VTHASFPARLRALAREPLLHFLVIGALLFAAISVARDLHRPTVRIDSQELEQLAGYWEMQTQRPPTRAELASIIRERIDEELLAREAVRLGLDKDDLIVRRRLAQKMSFASEDAGASAEPSEAQLQALYDSTRDTYATPARLALRHVFFSADRTGVRPEVAANEALADLKAGRAATGDASLLPLTYADVSLAELGRDYGDAFAAAARAAPVGQWVGPVQSAYGMHLIRVERRMAQEVPPLAAVRSDVRAAWLAERREAASRKYLDGLRRKYRVIVAGAPA
jgi:peptidyl-prolyl cis-trans isomerase C